MKLLFLITALCSEVRIKIRTEHHGVTYLTESINLIISEASGETGHNLDNEEGVLMVQLFSFIFVLTKKLPLTCFHLGQTS